MKKHTKLEQIKHFLSLIWLLIKLLWKTIRNKYVWFAIGFIVWTYCIAWFNANYEVKAMWKFGIYPRSTVSKKLTVAPQVMAQTIKPTPMPLTEEQIVKQAKYGDELWNIYMLESTRGKNDGCRKSGQFGGFGVMSLGVPACYESFEKAVERASYWYEKIRDNNDLATSVCIWNLGTKVNNCMYYQKFMSL